MSEILSNTGVKLWSETDYSELWLTVFDQLTGQGGKSNIRLIDEAIGKINAALDGYKFEFSSDEDRLYISKGDSKLPVSLIDSNGHVASKVDGTTITIDESGVVKGIPVDDALSEESTNPLQNKVIAGELKSIKSKMGTDESTIQNNTKRIEANETAISTLNGTGNGSVKKAVSDGIAKVVAGAPEDFDTLKEMSDWINSHESSASAMNSQIQDNKKAIDNHTLNGDIHVTMENKTNWNKVSEKLDKTGDASNVITEFTTATTRSNLTTKEKLSISLGKISKWFSDLKTVAFSGSYNDLSNKPASLPASDVSAWAKASTKPTYTKAEVGLGNVDNTADANKSVKYATSAGNATKVNNHTVNADVPSGAKFTDTTYGVATTTKAGIVKPDGTTITADEDGTLHGVKVTVDDAMSSTSTNPVQNKVVKAYVDKKASENVDFSTSTSKLLNDSIEAQLVLSNATRNLLNPTLATITQNGITCTNNGDGTYTFNGTATTGDTYFDLIPWSKIAVGKYRIVGCPIGGNKDGYYIEVNAPKTNELNTYYKDIGNGATFETYNKADSNIIVRIRINAGTTVSNLVFKPMLTKDLTATYDDFVPYSGYDIKTCGKNLLNPTLQTTTQNGVTCTNNGDGTYTFNGTNNTDSAIWFALTDFFTLEPNKEYKLVGGYPNSKRPFEDDNVLWFLELYTPMHSLYYARDFGDGRVFTATEPTVAAEIGVRKGATLNNFTFKPMVTTNLNATYDDFEAYQDGGSVHIDSTTEFPLLGLKSFDGETNIISPGNVEVTYAKSDSGKAIVDTLKKSVSDGKTKVANAITDKGVETATDATFDVMAENISKIETGGGELHGATLAVSTEESTLFGQTVTLTLNGASVGTTEFADNGTCSFVVQNPGTYTITCGEAHKEVTVTGDNVVNKTVISVELSILKIVAFATGTDEEIAKMIQAHYNDKINIADYWAVGDTRSVSLSAMSATGVGESHRAQTVQFVIGDFEHDDLATAINGHTKAAITLLQKDCLMDATSASNVNNGSSDTEKGYMNSTNTNVGGWKSCARRTWCNNVYFNAFPSAWQSMVKTVNKKVSVGNNSSTIETVQDKIFLAAEIEIFGSTIYSFAGEGTQYTYYKNATANRYKMPKWNSSSVTHIYWERSPYSGHSLHFCSVDYDGNVRFSSASSASGVAPCLCI